jgi:hypothetical protein
VTTRSKAATGLGILVVGLLAAAAFMLWPRDTAEISEQDAVADFRSRDTSSTTAPDSPQRSVPEPGVYTYAAVGEEQVKLGPLPAETRPLPASVTAVAVDAGEGCFDWTVNLFAEHTEDTRWCTDPVLQLDGHTKHQQIGVLSPTAIMVCNPNQMPDEASGPARSTELSCTFEMTGGPASITATLAGNATIAEKTAIDIDGAQVAVTPINLHYAVTGDLTGTWDETTWWTTEHLPVRIERTLDLSGPATFSETSKLQLTSLTPAS